MEGDSYNPLQGKQPDKDKEPPKALPGGLRPLGLPEFQARPRTGALEVRRVAQQATGQLPPGPPPVAPARQAPPVAPTGSLLAPAEAGIKDEWKDHLKGPVTSLMAFLGPRVEFLARACSEAGLPLGGVDLGFLAVPASPTGQKFVAYLTPVLQRDPELARAVVIAVTYHHEVSQQVELFERGPRWKRPDLGKFRSMLLYLGNLQQTFKRDTVLASLFPMAPPEVKLAQPRATARLIPREEREAIQAALQKARALAQDLHPRIGLVKQALDDLDKPVLKTLGEIFSPGAARLKLVVLAMRGKPELETRLRETVDAYERFLAALKQSEAKHQVADEIRDLVLPLGRLAQAYRDEPQIAALFA